MLPEKEGREKRNEELCEIAAGWLFFPSFFLSCLPPCRVSVSASFFFSFWERERKERKKKGEREASFYYSVLLLLFLISSFFSGAAAEKRIEGKNYGEERREGRKPESPPVFRHGAMRLGRPSQGRGRMPPSLVPPYTGVRFERYFCGTWGEGRKGEKEKRAKRGGLNFSLLLFREWKTRQVKKKGVDRRKEGKKEGNNRIFVPGAAPSFMRAVPFSASSTQFSFLAPSPLLVGLASDSTIIRGHFVGAWLIYNMFKYY